MDRFGLDTVPLQVGSKPSAGDLGVDEDERLTGVALEYAAEQVGNRLAMADYTVADRRVTDVVTAGSTDPATAAPAGRFVLVMLDPEDAAAQGIADGDVVQLGNVRGDIRLYAKITDGVKPGVLIAEGIWPNSAHLDGEGINVLTGADPVAPYGGAAFHDNRVWLRKA